MKIDLRTLAAEGFRLDLPNDGSPSDRVDIATVRALRGTYHQTPRRIHIEAAAADQLDVDALTWHLASGRISSPGRIELREAALDLDIPRAEAKKTRSTQGRIAFAHGDFLELAVVLGTVELAAHLELMAFEARIGNKSQPTTVVASELIAKSPRVLAPGASLTVAFGTLSARSLDVALAAGGDQSATAARLVATDVELATPSLSLRVARLVATGLRFARPAKGPLQVHAAELALEGLDIELAGAGTRLAVTSATVRELSYVDGAALAITRAEIDAVRVEHDLAKRASAPASSPAPTSRRQGKRSGGLDLTFLDHLEGRIDVDVTVDAKVPFLDRRRAVHHFRVPVHHGTIDYKRLERDLSALEDALLDFEVRKGRLVLEVAPPLLPFPRQTLVEWPLDEAELALAERRQVKLRTLSRARVPPPKSTAKKSGDPSFAINRLDFAPIDVALSLGGPAQIDLGAAGRIRLGAKSSPAIADLTVKGELHHRATTTQPKPTELRISTGAVHVGADALALGARTLTVADSTLASLEDGVVVARDLHPVRVSATLRRLALGALELTTA